MAEEINGMLVKHFTLVLCKGGMCSEESGVQLPTPRPACDSGGRTFALIWMTPSLGRVPFLR